MLGLISEKHTDSPSNATTFKPYPGVPGKRDGLRLKAGREAGGDLKTGIGASGKFVKSELQLQSVTTSHSTTDHHPSTIVIFVASTSGTLDFEESRSGYYLLPSPKSRRPPSGHDSTRVVHEGVKTVTLGPN